MAVGHRDRRLREEARFLSLWRIAGAGCEQTEVGTIAEPRAALGWSDCLRGPAVNGKQAQLRAQEEAEAQCVGWGSNVSLLVV